MTNIVNEAGLSRSVTELLTLRGWMWHHQRPGQTSGGRWNRGTEGNSGFPDIVAVRHGRVVFIELKAQNGQVSPEQTAWHNALRIADVDAFIWRPSHWPAIERELM